LVEVDNVILPFEEALDYIISSFIEDKFSIILFRSPSPLIYIGGGPIYMGYGRSLTPPSGRDAKASPAPGGTGKVASPAPGGTGTERPSRGRRLQNPLSQKSNFSPPLSPRGEKFDFSRTSEPTPPYIYRGGATFPYIYKGIVRSYEKRGVAPIYRRGAPSQLASSRKLEFFLPRVYPDIRGKIFDFL